MIKKISIFSLVLLVVSCKASINAEVSKSAKSSAASSRLNASDSNTKDVFRELDETTIKSE